MLYKIFVALFVLLFLPSCCAFSKRSCYPKCPLPKVHLVTSCVLPGKIHLPSVTKSEKCLEGLHCFDDSNMARIVVRERRLKGWIKEARLRCSPPTSAPSTLPSTQPLK